MCPEELQDLWAHYLELAATRSWGQAGPLSITWQELAAYDREACVQLLIWEKLILRRIDEAVIPALGKKIRHRLSGKPDPVVIRADQPSAMRSFFRTMVKAITPSKKE